MIGPRFPDLLAAAQGGEEQAFAVLWRDLQPAVLRYFHHGNSQASPSSISAPSTSVSPPSSGPPADPGPPASTVPGGHGQGGPPTTSG